MIAGNYTGEMIDNSCPPWRRATIETHNALKLLLFGVFLDFVWDSGTMIQLILKRSQHLGSNKKLRILKTGGHSIVRQGDISKTFLSTVLLKFYADEPGRESSRR